MNTMQSDDYKVYQNTQYEYRKKKSELERITALANDAEKLAYDALYRNYASQDIGPEPCRDIIL